MSKRYFSASAAEAQIISGIDESATSLTINIATGYPSTLPFIIVVGNGTSSEEVMLVTARSGTGSTFAITRGYDSTNAYSHATGSSVIHAASAIDFREANHFINGEKTWGNLKDGS